MYFNAFKPGTDLEQNSRYSIDDSRTMSEKLLSLPKEDWGDVQIKSFIKTSLLKFLNSFFIDIVIVTGKNPQNLEGYLHKKIERIFSHGFDYNYFLEMKKKNIIRDRNKKKLYKIFM